MDISTQLEESTRHWQRHPLAWVSDHFGDNIKLTAQQAAYFKELGKLIQAKYLLARNFPMNKEQARYASKIGVSIMAGKGVGKDFTAALTILFWLDVFKDSRIPCTANNSQQLQNVLWAEIASVMAKAKRIEGSTETVLEAKFNWQSQKISHREHRETWFAEALAYPQHGTPEMQARTLTGRHSRFLLAVLDECADIPDPVWSPVETTLTGALNIALLIFNPTKSRGFAYESQTTYKDNWIALQWSQEDCPELIPRAMIEAKEAKYGRDNNTFRVSVLGLPPHAGSGVFIPMEWVTAAMHREFEENPDSPVIFGVDVGGGGDKTVICVRQGGTVSEFLRNNSANQMEIADWVAAMILKYRAAVAYIDICGGYGAGVYDKLIRMGYRCRPADARKRDSDKYYNNRNMWYARMREQFEAGIICIPSHERDLFDQLNAITIDNDEGRLGGKKNIRKLLGGDSPDEADALAMTFAGNDDVFRGTGKETGVDWSDVYLR